MSKWTFYCENIGTDLKVATLTNNNGMAVLDVYEGSHSHYTVPKYAFLQMFSVNFTREETLLLELEDKDGKTLAEKKLEIACKEIKADYKKQVEKIKLVLGL